MVDEIGQCRFKVCRVFGRTEVEAVFVEGFLLIVLIVCVLPLPEGLFPLPRPLPDIVGRIFNSVSWKVSGFFLVNA